MCLCIPYFHWVDFFAQKYIRLWFHVQIFCFSYDARNGGPDNGRRWSDEDRGFGDRAHFQLHRYPSVLHVEKIQAKESGIYRCRVDFKTAPTRNSLLNLTVISKFYITP